MEQKVIVETLDGKPITINRNIPLDMTRTQEPPNSSLLRRLNDLCTETNPPPARAHISTPKPKGKFTIINKNFLKNNIEFNFSKVTPSTSNIGSDTGSSRTNYFRPLRLSCKSKTPSRSTKKAGASNGSPGKVLMPESKSSVKNFLKGKSILLSKNKLKAYVEDKKPETVTSSSVNAFLEKDILDKGLEVLDSLDSKSFEDLVTKVMNVVNTKHGDYLERELKNHLGPERYELIAQHPETEFVKLDANLFSGGRVCIGRNIFVKTNEQINEADTFISNKISSFKTRDMKLDNFTFTSPKLRKDIPEKIFESPKTLIEINNPSRFFVINDRKMIKNKSISTKKSPKTKIKQQSNFKEFCSLMSSANESEITNSILSPRSNSFNFSDLGTNKDFSQTSLDIPAAKFNSLMARIDNRNQEQTVKIEDDIKLNKIFCGLDNGCSFRRVNEKNPEMNKNKNLAFIKSPLKGKSKNKKINLSKHHRSEKTFEETINVVLSDEDSPKTINKNDKHVLSLTKHLNDAGNAKIVKTNNKNTKYVRNPLSKQEKTKKQTLPTKINNNNKKNKITNKHKTETKKCTLQNKVAFRKATDKEINIKYDYDYKNTSNISKDENEHEFYLNFSDNKLNITKATKNIEIKENEIKIKNKGSTKVEAFGSFQPNEEGDKKSRNSKSVMVTIDRNDNTAEFGQIVNKVNQIKIEDSNKVCESIKKNNCVEEVDKESKIVEENKANKSTIIQRTCKEDQFFLEDGLKDTETKIENTVSEMSKSSISLQEKKPEMVETAKSKSNKVKSSQAPKIKSETQIGCHSNKIKEFLTFKDKEPEIAETMTIDVKKVAENKINTNKLLNEESDFRIEHSPKKILETEIKTIEQTSNIFLDKKQAAIIDKTTKKVEKKTDNEIKTTQPQIIQSKLPVCTERGPKIIIKPNEISTNKQERLFKLSNDSPTEFLTRKPEKILFSNSKKIMHNIQILKKFEGNLKSDEPAMDFKEKIYTDTATDFKEVIPSSANKENICESKKPGADIKQIILYPANQQNTCKIEGATLDLKKVIPHSANKENSCKSFKLVGLFKEITLHLANQQNTCKIQGPVTDFKGITLHPANQQHTCKIERSVTDFKETATNFKEVSPDSVSKQNICKSKKPDIAFKELILHSANQQTTSTIEGPTPDFKGISPNSANEHNTCKSKETATEGIVIEVNPNSANKENTSKSKKPAADFKQITLNSANQQKTCKIEKPTSDFNEITLHSVNQENTCKIERTTADFKEITPNSENEHNTCNSKETATDFNKMISNSATKQNIFKSNKPAADFKEMILNSANQQTTCRSKEKGLYLKKTNLNSVNQQNTCNIERASLNFKEITPNFANEHNTCKSKETATDEIVIEVIPNSANKENTSKSKKPAADFKQITLNSANQQNSCNIEKSTSDFNEITLHSANQEHTCKIERTTADFKEITKNSENEHNTCNSKETATDFNKMISNFPTKQNIFKSNKPAADFKEIILNSLNQQTTCRSKEKASYFKEANLHFANQRNTCNIERASSNFKEITQNSANEHNTCKSKETAADFKDLIPNSTNVSNGKNSCNSEEPETIFKGIIAMSEELGVVADLNTKENTPTLHNVNLYKINKATPKKQENISLKTPKSKLPKQVPDISKIISEESLGLNLEQNRVPPNSPDIRTIKNDCFEAFAQKTLRKIESINQIKEESDEESCEVTDEDEKNNRTIHKKNAKYYQCLYMDMVKSDPTYGDIKTSMNSQDTSTPKPKIPYKKRKRFNKRFEGDTKYVGISSNDSDSERYHSCTKKPRVFKSMRKIPVDTLEDFFEMFKSAKNSYFSLKATVRSSSESTGLIHNKRDVAVNNDIIPGPIVAFPLENYEAEKNKRRFVTSFMLKSKRRKITKFKLARIRRNLQAKVWHSLRTYRNNLKTYQQLNSLSVLEDLIKIKDNKTFRETSLLLNKIKQNSIMEMNQYLNTTKFYLRKLVGNKKFNKKFQKVSENVCLQLRIKKDFGSKKNKCKINYKKKINDELRKISETFKLIDKINNKKVRPKKSSKKSPIKIGKVNKLELLKRIGIPKNLNLMSSKDALMKTETHNTQGAPRKPIINKNKLSFKLKKTKELSSGDNGAKESLQDAIQTATNKFKSELFPNVRRSSRFLKQIRDLNQETKNEIKTMILVHGHPPSPNEEDVKDQSTFIARRCSPRLAKKLTDSEKKSEGTNKEIQTGVGENDPLVENREKLDIIKIDNVLEESAATSSLATTEPRGMNSRKAKRLLPFPEVCPYLLRSRQNGNNPKGK